MERLRQRLTLARRALPRLEEIAFRTSVSERALDVAIKIVGEEDQDGRVAELGHEVRLARGPLQTSTLNDGSGSPGCGPENSACSATPYANARTLIADLCAKRRDRHRA